MNKTYEDSSKINYYCILGERCSGTNFLEESLIKNFNLQRHNYQINKHFFGFKQLPLINNNILFIGIVRHPYTWMNSLYKYPYYLQKNMRYDKNNFLNNECWSETNNLEILQDRNIYTNQRYKNIFDLRKTKLQYLYDDMPKLVDNYLLLKYEELRDNYIPTLNMIKDKYKLTPNPEFPVYINDYKGRGKLHKENFSIDNKYIFSKEEILLNNNFDKTYETKLKYYLI